MISALFRSRMVVTLVLLGTVLVGVLGLILAAPFSASQPPRLDLYLIDHEPRPGANVFAVDLHTLEPHPITDSPLEAHSSMARTAIAGDGRTWVSLLADGNLVVLDGPAGPERLRVAAPGPVGQLLLSVDGRRLVVLPPDETDRLQPPPPRWDAWTVIDTSTGTVQSSATAPPPAGFVVRAWLHPDGVATPSGVSTGKNAVHLPAPPTRHT